MERNELETLIRFAKSNGIMNWPFEDVVNEYKTVKIQHEEPRFDTKTLKPFDKVLVRDEDCYWTADLFSHIDDSIGRVCCSWYSWKQCIPYNDETKNLVGTTDDCPEYYKWWEE